MNATPGFFATLFSVCRGTAELPVFIGNRFGKVFWHLLLLALLIAFVIASGWSFRLDRDLADVRRTFAGAFGEHVVFDGHGIFPGRDEERACSILLPHKGKLYYAGNHSDAVRGLGDLGGVDYLVLWRGGSLAVGCRNEDLSWNVFRPGEFFTAPDQESALELLLKEPEPRDVSGKVSERVSLDVSTLGDVLLGVYWTTVFVFEVVNILFLALTATGIFSLFLSLGNRGVDVGTSFRESVSRFFRRYLIFWKSGLYAGFPAMIIAGCFPLLDLPFFDYGQVYFFALFIYWLTILWRCKNEWAGADPASPGGFYDK